jgi:hypothetical protein
MQIPDGTSSIASLGIGNGDSLVVRQGQPPPATAAEPSVTEPALSGPHPHANSPGVEGSTEEMVSDANRISCDPADQRIVRASNTHTIQECLISEAY